MSNGGGGDVPIHEKETIWNPQKIPCNCFTRCYFSRIGIYKCIFPNTECVCSTKVGAAQNRLLLKLPTWVLGNTRALSFKIARLNHLVSEKWTCLHQWWILWVVWNAASSHLSRHRTSAKGLVWALPIWNGDPYHCTMPSVFRWGYRLGSSRESSPWLPLTSWIP